MKDFIIHEKKSYGSETLTNMLHVLYRILRLYYALYLNKYMILEIYFICYLKSQNWMISNSCEIKLFLMVKVPWEETCWIKKRESNGNKEMGSVFHSMVVFRYRALTGNKQTIELWKKYSSTSPLTYASAKRFS